MDTIERAAVVLADAEKKLRELVGVAAAAGQYDPAMRVAQWAKVIAALCQDRTAASGRNGSCLELGAVSDPRAEGPHNGAHELGRSAPASQLRARTPLNAARQGRRSPVKGEYPKFLRRADQLVKIGWSKKERTEYEHRAPRRAIELLADAISRKGNNGKLFTSDDVLPLRDPSDGSEVPGYQGYVALAWFKIAGIINQNGRRGYTAKKNMNVVERAATLWAGLPEQDA